MAKAAVPAYMGTDLGSASPGLRFGMYLPAWQDDWQRVRETEQVYRKTTRLNDNDQAAAAALLERQRSLAAAVASVNSAAGTPMLTLEAQSVAPFSTGLGNEHPLENGFAFLNPHGLPYLAGSGVKGVLREAARELADGSWGDAHGWSDVRDMTLELDKDDRLLLSAIDVLFGLESEDGDKHHLRGALTFWDVFPQMETLEVEIMTAHHSHYLQGTDVPHASGSPNPIPFLAVPPNTRFVFHVQCDLPFLQRIAPQLVGKWDQLMMAALQHAFDWLGFGAKTAVGYGAMEIHEDVRKAIEEELEASRKAQAEASEREQHERAVAALSPAEQEVATCLFERLDKNQPELPTLINALKGGRWDADSAMKGEVALLIKARMQVEGNWKETSQKKRPERDRDHQNTLLIMAALPDA